jgi:hypothetical protein
MEKFTITEMSYAIIAICGAISGVLMVVWKSRCRKIDCCWGGARCDREPLHDETVYRRTDFSPNVIETTL